MRLLLILSLLSSPALAVRVDSFVTPFDTGYQSELLTRLHIGNSLKYGFKTLFSVELTGVRAGDILDLSAVGELTNDETYAVMLGCRIDIGSGPEPYNQVDTVLTGRSYNISHEMHHGVLPSLSNPGYIFKRDYDRVYVNVIVWAAAYAARPNDYLTVDLGYGRLIGKVLRLK